MEYKEKEGQTNIKFSVQMFFSNYDLILFLYLKYLIND